MKAVTLLQLAAPFVIAILVGAGVALETPTNALLAKSSGSFLWASLFSFLVGAVVLIAALAVRRPALALGWSGAPWYAWVGGVYGALLVVGSAWATPKLGAGTTLVVIVASQVVLGVVLDHFSLLGLAHHPVSGLRLAGVMIVALGAVLIARG